jgi:hypothetical protein
MLPKGRAMTGTRRTLLSIAVFCALAGPSAVAIAAPASAVKSFAAASSAVLIASEGCDGHLYKPRKVILACADANLYVTGLHYSAYSGTEAKANGVFHLNDCTPDCAGGRFHAHGGMIRFFDVVHCADGRRYFSQARYSFPSKGGKGVADIEPFLRCKAR